MRRTSRQGSERRSSIANFPRVLTEDAQEPDHRPLGRVWHALDERAVAHGAARRQARRFRSIAHVHCRNRLASGGVVTESATSLPDLPGRDDGMRSGMPALCHHHGLPRCRDVLDLPIRFAPLIHEEIVAPHDAFYRRPAGFTGIAVLGTLRDAWACRRDSGRGRASSSTTGARLRSRLLRG